MKVSGRYGDGKIGVTRFIIGYYMRWILILLLRRNLVIIDQASGKQHEETKDERTGDSHV
jgi:hypothetical protein